MRIFSTLLAVLLLVSASFFLVGQATAAPETCGACHDYIGESTDQIDVDAQLTGLGQIDVNTQLTGLGHVPIDISETDDAIREKVRFRHNRFEQKAPDSPNDSDFTGKHTPIDTNANPDSLAVKLE